MSMSTERKAPPGKFIVGEADMSEGKWGQVEKPHNTFKEAMQAAAMLQQDTKHSQLTYFVYDENGLVQSAPQAQVHQVTGREM